MIWTALSSFSVLEFLKRPNSLSMIKIIWSFDWWKQSSIVCITTMVPRVFFFSGLLKCAEVYIKRTIVNWGHGTDVYGKSNVSVQFLLLQDFRYFIKNDLDVAFCDRSNSNHLSAVHSRSWFPGQLYLPLLRTIRCLQYNFVIRKLLCNRKVSHGIPAPEISGL